MTRDEAVTRITDALGFNTALTAKAILRINEAQRELEAGKTLPTFLLFLDQTLTLVAGNSFANLPANFLRLYNDTPLRYTPTGSTKPSFVPFKRGINYTGVLEANFSTGRTAPQVAIIRQGNQTGFVDFITVADKNYAFTWSYYVHDTVPSANGTNAWLTNAPDWLIGEAGWRLAMDARDKDAIQVFDALRKSGRAACFGDIVASEEASGQVMMGENL